ncbi:complement C3-like [Melanotaenia boesemani]|uniref:complement C3-like n=1 Tax=Melanotaenia boesemani TaxID=1250792 RepID=UPI001C043655|nr:complement C3-like [Melanotaenia boesemani]
MASGRRMRWIQLLLVACVSYSSLVSPATGSQLEVMSAPSILRVGTPEKIFVEIQDYAGQDAKNVNILVKNHPTKDRLLTSTQVTLTRANNYQGFGGITIPAGGFSNDPKVKQYVYLQADFHGQMLEKVVLITFQSGYIFIQTDKTIYTPASKVHYRVFALQPSMEPVEKGSQVESDNSLKVEIETSKGIVIKSDIVSLEKGMHSESFTLPEVVSMGNWKVVAKFQSNPHLAFYSEFEVKEYVLPSFEVKLSTPPESPFFYVDSAELTITIQATYVFGKDVDGTAYAVFGCMTEGNKKAFPGSLQRVPIYKGTGEVTLKKEHITQTFPQINDLVGSSIYVTVNVLTDSGGEMGEAELRGIKIVTSPYTITFTKTPKYFKPGMSFDVMVEVLNPDGSPANSICVVVEPGSVKANTQSNGIARLTINSELNTDKLGITAKTDKPGLESNRQATATMDAYPYHSGSKSYLHISVDAAEVEIGQDIKMTLIINNPEGQKDITYLILSRGQLVKHVRYQNQGLNQIVQMLRITKEMLPSFRIVAYYHTNSGELVSDSIWVDAKDSCMGSLDLSIVKPVATYEPRKSFKLKITGDPEATVGLVAVDKAVYVLNNKHRLTQKKIWDTVEQYDPGCSPGGGKDSMAVFYDAGLMLETGSNYRTAHRTELKCPSSSRKKRASTIMDVRTSLLRELNKALQECCLDGMREVPVSYSCQRRSEYIVGDTECSKAFLRCCEEMAKQRDATKDQMLQLARSDKDDGYDEDAEITIRSKFPESWHWMDIQLNPCRSNDPNCKTTSFEQIVPLQDSITTWQFTGISLSRTHGICVAKSLEVVVYKPFFIDLRHPYSVVRGEQVEIKAILHNYNTDPVTVRVDLKEVKGVCSSAYKKGWFQQEVMVAAESSRSVPFIIIPMTLGEITVVVKALIKGSHYGDGIEKTIRVVPQGVKVEIEKNVRLEPGKRGGTQVETINSQINATDMAPDTPMNTLIAVTGREQMSSLIENVFSGKSMGTMIQEPHGCGEQNMINLTPTVIATIYLDKTNKWEDVGFEQRNTALKHMKTGYQSELAYRKDDGSFTVFMHTPSTTWLTSYVTKVFAMAYELIAIDKNVICSAVKFLILKTQQPDGIFKEVGEVYHKEMIGDIGGEDSDASLTAFALIAMQESKTLCSETVGSLPNSIQKAVAFLEKQLPRLTNPYAVAMTSYALANENKLNKDILYKFAAPDRSHWPVPKGHIFTLEATAYALLALVKSQAFQDAKPVVRWLGQYQKMLGGYGSTQVTVMVYQAVAEYWKTVKEPEYTLKVDMMVPGKSLMDKYSFTSENHYAARTSKFQGINKDVNLTASGNGEGMFQMVSLYYALPENVERECEKYDLKLQLVEGKATEGGKTFKLRIDVLYKDYNRDAAMTILDIGLPTGYIFDKSDLETLSKGRDRIISKYETVEALSDRGSLIIYLDKVSHTRPDEISFRIHQIMNVGILQPAAVSVYDYYNRKPCVRFYRPGRSSGELQTLCTKEKAECLCAEEGCTFQKKHDVSNSDRTKKACETQNSKIDYVYKVQVENIQNGSTTDMYTLRILKVIKKGSKDEGPLNQLRAFLSYQQCREVLGLEKDKTYLIMGTSSDIHIINDQMRYMLGQNTWVEYWPVRGECQSPKYRPACLGMEDLIEQIEDYGCQQK